MDKLAVYTAVVDYYGHPLSVLRIDVNDHALSDRAAPFDASASEIHSVICGECYAATGGQLRSCSEPDIAVRRHDEVIYWYLVDRDCNPMNLPSDRLWSFSQADYQGQLSGSPLALPDFAPSDIDEVLGRQRLFEGKMGLYTIPDIPDDPQGRDLLDTITEIVHIGNLQVVARAPDKFVSLRVGIETPGIPECVVEIGMIEARCVIRFADNPAFPLWVTSDEAHRRMVHFVA